MAGVDLPVRAIREQVAGAVDLIIQQARLKDGTRRITQITEVIGMEGDIITLQDLFTFDYSAGRDAEGKFLGEPAQHGHPAEVHRGPRRSRHHAPAPPVHSRAAMNLSSGLARAFVTLAAGAALLGPATSATAAEPLPASIGGVRVTADHVIGVLTLRPGGESVSLDPGMTATVGGKTAPVSSKSAKGAQRTTVLLIDTSGSMGRSGMETVRSAVKTFLASAPKDVKIGVVSFGNTAGPEPGPHGRPVRGTARRRRPACRRQHRPVRWCDRGREDARCLGRPQHRPAQ